MNHKSKRLPQFEKDLGFRKAAFEAAKELVYAKRQSLCREAVMAAMRRRGELERKIALHEGVWWEELAPLAPAERGVVIAQLKSMWGIVEHEVS